MAAVQETVDRVRSIDVEAYKYGFVSPIESDVAPKGLKSRCPGTALLAVATLSKPCNKA